LYDFETGITLVSSAITLEPSSYANDISFSAKKNQMSSLLYYCGGYHNLPKEYIFWEQSEDVGVPLVYRSM
jgi:hypothetical protein